MTPPELFSPSDDDSHAVVAMDVVPPKREEDAERAVAGCPEQVITVEP